MRLIARSICLQAAALLLLCFALFTLPSFAQDAAAPEPAKPVEADAQEDAAQSPMSIELDINRLIFDNNVNSTQDPVWQFAANPGKRIVFIPFTVHGIHQTSKLSRLPISVRAGRFIGFVIPKPATNNQADDSAEINRIITAKSDELKQLLFDSNHDDGAASSINKSPDDEDALEPTPENAPRLAREIALHPDGTVQWPMARSFQSTRLNGASEQNLYAYKIDPEQLRNAQPEKAERITRNDGEDSRAFAQRKRDHQLAEREKVDAYRDLRDRLRDLPDSFREPMPSVLYAAMEVPAGDTLSLEGPSPLPWSLDDEKKQLFNQLSRGGANTLQDNEGRDISGSLITMMQGHPLDARAIAIATMRSRLAGQVTADDPGYKVITRLLQSDDVPTRRIALLGTAKILPPTLASAKLIGVAGEAALGEERKMLGFASLGKLFSTQSNDPEDARILIDRVSKTIADPEGPAAPQVIEQVLASLSPEQGSRRTQQNDPTTAVMIEAIDLAGLDKDEFAGVATAIIKQAPSNPVAAGWLDQKLLGSSDQDLVSQTLSLLNESEVRPPVQQNEQVSEDAPEATQDDVGLVLTDTIPITRADHALVRLLDSRDDLLAIAACSVLGKFHIELSPSDTQAVEEPGSESPPKDPSLALFDSIMGQANVLEPMPVSVVAFLRNQKTPSLEQPANDWLISILARPNAASAISQAALDAYLAAPQDYAQSITGLEAVNKHALAKAMYEAQNEEPALIFGLIADGGNTLNWLASFVSDNKALPAEEDWVAHAQTLGENALLQHTTSDDIDLVVAAASALVLTTGGDTTQEKAFAQTVAFMESRQVDLVSKEWAKQRNKIYEAAFKRAAGSYQLVVTLGQAKELTPEGEPEAGEPGKRIDLGVVGFRAEGLELSLSVQAVGLSPSPNQLGIRLDNPASLRSFSKNELSEIAPEHLSQPIDLLPQEGGGWTGQANLPEGRTISVSLEPVN